MQTNHDTCYIILQAYFLIGIAILYLIVTAPAFAILKLMRGKVGHLLFAGFWNWHLCTGAVIPTAILTRFATPVRYANFSETRFWFSFINFFGGLLGFIAAIALLILPRIALVQHSVNRQTN